MTRRNQIILVIVILLALLLVSRGYAQQPQPTSRDTTNVLTARSKILAPWQTEISRRQGMRVTVMRPLAARLDSLLAAWLIGTVQPPPPPPVDTIVPPPPVVVDTATGVTKPEKPRSVPSSANKPCGTVTPVAAGANLQSALDAAAPGGCIMLASAARFVGNFVLPDKTCTNGAWIRVSTAGVVDQPGIRVTPTDAASFAKILTNNNQPAISAAHPSKCWQLDNIEVAVDPSFTGLQYWLVALGDGGWSGGGEKNVSLAVQPTDFILRRVYIHGQTTSNLIRCLALNSKTTALVDSWLSECHGAGFDSQAVEGWNGAGPYLIENNFLSGAGENIMFGGADPAILNLRPCDITVRRNHIWKDPKWVGGPWSIKNLIENKNGCRIWYDANVVENSWPASQVGMAVVFKSSQDACGTCLWEGTTDVTFTNNIVRNSHRGLNLQANDASGQIGTNVFTSRVEVINNLWTGIGNSNGVAGSDGWLQLFVGPLSDILIQRNTFVGNAPGLGLVLMMSAPGAKRVTWMQNILAGQSYYEISNDQGQAHTAGLNWYAGNTWKFSGNLLSQLDPQFLALQPPNNTYVQTIGSIGFTSTFTTAKYPGVGADIATITTKTAGVVSLIPSSVPRGTPRGFRPRALTHADSVFLARQPKGTADILVGRPTAVSRPH